MLRWDRGTGRLAAAPSEKEKPDEPGPGNAEHLRRSRREARDRRSGSRPTGLRGSYGLSIAASAEARSLKTRQRITLPSRNVYTWVVSQTTSTPLPLPVAWISASK